eukprot:gene5287-biopygen4450
MTRCWASRWITANTSCSSVLQQHVHRILRSHKSTGDGRRARAAIGLQHIAVQGQRALAQGLQVEHATQRAADQAAPPGCARTAEHDLRDVFPSRKSQDFRWHVLRTQAFDLRAKTFGEAHGFARDIVAEHGANEAVRDVVTGIEQRLHFLLETGLGYLTLNRDYATLSGGEAQRVRLATQLGMGLIGVIYVLDEPSIGLHPHDNQKLLDTLVALRDRGNTVLVVEHDEDTMRLADELIELGPEAGVEGGQLLFQGTPAACAALSIKQSRTGPYLSRKLAITRDAKPKLPDGAWLTVREARANNLRGIDAKFPVGLLTCVTGVSGSGKSTLVNDVLAAAAARKLNGAKTIP